MNGTKEQYRYLMEQSDRCEQIALVYRNANELDLALFWHNASCGFKEKALVLPVNGLEGYLQ